MNLIPAHACAVVLYGRETCARFRELTAYWSDILDPAAWSRFLFVLIDGPSPEPPALPPALRAELRRSCWQMDAAALRDAGRPTEIIAELHQRIERDGVLVQCVADAYENLPAPTDALLNWLDAIQGDFAPGSVKTIVYLLLQGGADARVSQGAFARALADRAAAFPYLYLLGECAADGSTVSRPALWRALCGELLANAATCRTLDAGGMYSLGISSLNANNGELNAIRRDFALDALTRQSLRPITPQEGWRLLTRTSRPGPGNEAHEWVRAVTQWLEDAVLEQLVLPTASERGNLRLLAGLSQPNPARLETSIRRFYEINNPSGNSCREAALRYAQAHVAAIIDALRKKLNAPAFPPNLLKQAEKALDTVARSPVPPYLPLRPQRRAFPPEPARTYATRQCTAIEEECERLLKAKRVRLYAAALRNALGRLKSFLQAAGALADLLEKERLPRSRMNALFEKYDRYTAAVRDTAAALGERATPPDPQTSYFAPDGTPLAQPWRTAADGGVEKLHSRLPAECAGSFCQTVSWECSEREGLEKFFGDYLGESKRMFYALSDVSGAPQSLYYTDIALAGHPWFDDPLHETVVAHNDNVERVDLFALRHDLRWYLRGDPHFLADSAPAPSSSGLTRLWNAEPPLSPASEGASQPEALFDPPEPSEPRQSVPRMAILSDHDRFVLVWDWENGVDNAVVGLYQHDRLIKRHVCRVQEYNAPSGDLPNGLDITENLPYGPVRVEIRSSNGVYATRTLAGRKNRVTYCFQYRHGASALIIQGTPEDIARLTLCAPRAEGEGCVFYPLGIAENPRGISVEGLALAAPDRCELRPVPDDPYPSVYAVRR